MNLNKMQEEIKNQGQPRRGTAEGPANPGSFIFSNEDTEFFSNLDKEIENEITNPEKPNPLKNTRFSSLPMGATNNDQQVGINDAGFPVFKTFFGTEYVISPDLDQRTIREKITETAPVVTKAISSYIQDPVIPSTKQILEFGKDIAVGYYESVDRLMSGTGTMGDLYGNVAGIGAASAFTKVPEGSLRIFGGSRMKMNKSEISNFGKARKRFDELLGNIDETKSESFYSVNKQVWNETGWFINPSDKQWRFEIDDKKSNINYDGFKAYGTDALTLNENIYNISLDKNGTMLSLEKIFNHPELFKQYPQLKNLDINFKFDKNDNSLGFFSTGGIGRDTRIGINTAKVDITKVDELKDILVHEIQHAVQELEGFAVGANSKYIPKKVVTKLDDKIKNIKIKTATERKKIELRFVDLWKKGQKNNLNMLAFFHKESGLNKKNMVDNNLMKKGFNFSEDWLNGFFNKYNIEKNSTLAKDLKKYLAIYKEAYRAEYKLKPGKGVLKGNQLFKFYEGAGGEIESRLVQRTAKDDSFEKFVFPLDREKTMLELEDAQPEFIRKVDIEPSIATQIRKPKLGKADIFVTLPKKLKGYKYDEDGYINNSFYSVAETAEHNTKQIQSILKGHNEIKDIAKLKRGDSLEHEGVKYKFVRMESKEIEKGSIPEGNQIIQDTGSDANYNSILNVIVRPIDNPDIIKAKVPVQYTNPIRIPLSKVLEERGFNLDKLRKPRKDPNIITKKIKGLMDKVL